jgi:uncharacterized protein YndB with AHSA1/START domain
MERKTQVHAEDGTQEIFITREFELSVDQLFKAYVEPEIVEQWMGTKVLKLDNRKHGSYQFETTDPKGNTHRFNGTIHEFEREAKITRTFEMENSGFPVQLEFLEFEPISEGKSRLLMQMVFKSVGDRDRMLQLPFAQGISMAHDRLQETVQKLRNP